MEYNKYNLKLEVMSVQSHGSCACMPIHLLYVHAYTCCARLGLHASFGRACPVKCALTSLPTWTPKYYSNFAIFTSHFILSIGCVEPRNAHLEKKLKEIVRKQVDVEVVPPLPLEPEPFKPDKIEDVDRVTIYNGEEEVKVMKRPEIPKPPPPPKGLLHNGVNKWEG